MVGYYGLVLFFWYNIMIVLFFLFVGEFDGLLKIK